MNKYYSIISKKTKWSLGRCPFLLQKIEFLTQSNTESYSSHYKNNSGRGGRIRSADGRSQRVY